MDSCFGLLSHISTVIVSMQTVRSQYTMNTVVSLRVGPFDLGGNGYVFLWTSVLRLCACPRETNFTQLRLDVPNEVGIRNKTGDK